MTFREIILTQRLLTLKIQKLKKIQNELNIRKKPYTTKAYMDLLTKSIENNAVYCKGCNKPIDKSHIGQPIVFQKNTSSYVRKWFHKSCAEQKSIVYKELGEPIIVQN